MARQWVILGQHKEPLHKGSGLPPENRNGRHRRAKSSPRHSGGGTIGDRP